LLRGRSGEPQQKASSDAQIGASLPHAPRPRNWAAGARNMPIARSNKFSDPLRMRLHFEGSKGSSESNKISDSASIGHLIAAPALHNSNAAIGGITGNKKMSCSAQSINEMNGPLAVTSLWAHS